MFSRPQSRGTMSNYRDGRSGEGNMQHQQRTWGGNGGNRTGGQNIGQGQRRGRGRGNQGNQGYGGNRQQGGIQQQPGQAKPKSGTTLKFDNDYDFEVANTQFEELRSQLSKVKISERQFINIKNYIILFQTFFTEYRFYNSDSFLRIRKNVTIRVGTKSVHQEVDKTEKQLNIVFLSYLQTNFF